MTFSKLQFSEFKKFFSRSVFGEPQLMDQVNSTHIIEFSNFLLQLKNERSGSKTLCGFYIILILKRILTFSSQQVHAFRGTKI